MTNILHVKYLPKLLDDQYFVCYNKVQSVDIGLGIAKKKKKLPKNNQYHIKSKRLVSPITTSV